MKYIFVFRNIYRLSIFVILILTADALPAGFEGDSVNIICGELLARPEKNSVTINSCADRAMDLYYEYGTDSLNYVSQTNVYSAADSVPVTVRIENLLPDTRYYYRMRYRKTGTSVFSARASRTFHTQRPKGTSFTFAIEADPHMDTNSLGTVYAQTLRNLISKNPDFLIDLGDTFMSEKLPVQNPATIKERHLLLRNYFDIACHSVPLFLVSGNHDGELGWRHNNTAECLPVWAANTRKQYYPNPVPDSFYTGNSVAEPFVGLRENYYAWEWGDALFVVLDPYWYTKTKPGWGWTLGADQFNWFKNTISASNAKFKFVFCHQLVAGYGNDGRGGIEYAHLYEHGGRNTDSTWGFDSSRPGWGKPVHQLMVENNVSVFFHGHDHFYGKQDLDGIVYQEVPQPSLKSFTNLSAASYGYVNGVILPNRGYLLVTVNDTSAKVEYIRTYLPNEENATRHNGDISHSYTIIKNGTPSSTEDYSPEPAGFALYQNYPNPFNPETIINYQIPTINDQSDAVRVTLIVYDILGNEVAALVKGYKSAGSYSVSFDASQAGLPGGVYYYRLVAGPYTQTMKMICLK